MPNVTGIALQITPNSRPVMLDEDLSFALFKSIPCEDQYNELATIYQEWYGRETRNLLKTRREQYKALFRKKKDRFAKWEKLDSLYFYSCRLLHQRYPQFKIYNEFAGLFKPQGIAELTLDVIDRIILKYIAHCEDEVINYELEIKCGKKNGLCFKPCKQASGHVFDLRLLYSLAESLPVEEKYFELAGELAGLGEDAVTMLLIEKGLHGSERPDMFWNNTNIGISRQLVKLQSFIQNLTDTQAEDIMRMDDYWINRELKANIADLRKLENSSSRRISAKTLERLLEFLSS